MPFIARVEGSCGICGGTIVPGAVTRPIEFPVIEETGAASEAGSSSSAAAVLALNASSYSKKNGRLVWCHIDCVDSEDPRIPVCKHWKRSLECVYMSTCLFRHPADYGGGSDREVKRHGAKGRLRVYNEGRASSLRRWLISVFGEEYLRSGSGIIEVAGGKGELSFELQNLNNIPSCVFDPRPLELRR
jgi:hypothetical protein